MSDAGEKRFEPTPHRKEKAKRDGSVARSAELGGVASFGAATLATVAAAPLLAGAAIGAVRPGGSRAALAVLAAGACAPAGAAAAAALAAGFAQAGGIHVGTVRFDLAKLHPISGLKRMTGGEAAVALARAALAFITALGALGPVAYDAVAAAASLHSPADAVALVARAALRAAIGAFVVGVLFAGADYALAKRRWVASLRMSPAELKRDAKESEGDPHARSRRKTLHRTLVRGAIARTRDASFVIVNPVHVAVALRYAPPSIPVPEILVRAAGDAAQRVKAIARDHGVPIVEDVALARLLYATGAVGRAIPAETFVAVAQIVAALARAEVAAS